MRRRHLSLGVLGLAAFLTAQQAPAATITHTSIADFQAGLASGAATVVGETNQGAGPDGGVMIMPPLGDPVITDELDYSSTTQASNWLFEMTDAGEATSTALKSEFLFSGDTSANGGTAPAAGVLRMRASNNFTADDPAHVASGTTRHDQRQIMLALNKTPLTGDFVVETHMTFADARQSSRQHGLFIGQPILDASNNVTGVSLDAPDGPTDPNSGLIDTTKSPALTGSYLLIGPKDTNQVLAGARLYGRRNNRVLQTGMVSYYNTNGGFPGTDAYVRVVKRGAYFYIYVKMNATDPWTFCQWWKIPQLAANPNAPVVVGFFEKNWNTSGTATYEATDYDYLHVNRIGTDLTGAYTNVMDAGQPSNWTQLGSISFYATSTGRATFAPNGPVPVAQQSLSREGVKVQVRTGNTLANGTLTDAGPFVGPDGTANTTFTDDINGRIPNGAGKRYLEYKLTMDGSTVNLPAMLKSITAMYQPAGAAILQASDKAEYGADSDTIQTQPGDGDLSLARTPVWRDDFTGTDYTQNGWSLFNMSGSVPPSTTLYTDPQEGTTAVGDATSTERPGYLRMKVGYDQNLWGGAANKTGGVTVLHDISQMTNLDTNNFEVETEINWEVSQSRIAALVLWQDQSNYVGIGLSRAHGYSPATAMYFIGPAGDSVLGDAGQSTQPNNVDYGTNTLQVRLTKTGQYITAAYRDPNVASPSWRVLYVWNAGAGFYPTQVGFLGKSSDDADQTVNNYDFNYLSLANVASAGTKDITLNLPAGATPDSIVLSGDNISAQNLRVQVDDGKGNFVGAGGDAGSYFTINEPHLPTSLQGLSQITLRVSMDATDALGQSIPYLHAIGVSCALPGSAIAHDATWVDFNRATVKNNVNLDVSGSVKNAGGTTLVPAAQYDFSTNTVADGTWVIDNPSGKSSVNWTENPGFARMYISDSENLWKGTAKNYMLFRQAAQVSGDFAIETFVNEVNGRTPGYFFGLTVWVDNKDLMLFGPYDDGSVQGSLEILNTANDAFPRDNKPNWPDSSYYLRIVRIGTNYSFYVKGVSDTDWTLLQTLTNSVLSNKPVYVGLLGKSFPVTGYTLAPAPGFPVDFDYFTVDSVDATGTLESRHLDLGVPGLTPVVDSFGGNASNVQLQFRAADTDTDLANATYVGPDGTPNTSFAGTYTGALPAALNGKQYFQYKAVLPQNAYLKDIQIVGIGSSVGTGPLTRDDALSALKIAGGITPASAADKSRLDVNTSGTVDVSDAAQILRTVMGL